MWRLGEIDGTHTLTIDQDICAPAVCSEKQCVPRLIWVILAFVDNFQKLEFSPISSLFELSSEHRRADDVIDALGELNKFDLVGIPSRK